MKYMIYLFRHGQTYYNKSGRFTGDINSHLTPQGVKDAKKIAQKLKGNIVDYAFQTRLSRSKDTLKYVLRFHPECKKIINDDRMIERDYGLLKGKYHARIIVQYGQKQFDTWHRSYETRPPGGESIKDVEKRVEAFIKDLLIFMKKHKGNVAISAHGNSMRPFRKHFEHLSREKMMQLENPWDDYFAYSVENEN
ncbi:histidine phosphatase family protein [Candidatus Woesearchaeota archaeon]|nr:histidine phosphatase family protein [Candidatus Woesearchaeota archaeon]